MTPIEDLIRREISATGPMSVARYMELCLSHPEHGYYMTRDPLGVAGDFTTAPEISQMFGEMIGAWAALVWRGIGRRDFKLIELGPGRGSLMADALRVVRAAGAAPEVWMVETSPRLREEQALRVPDAQWTETLTAVPKGPAVIIANEFLDALPVRQLIYARDGWRERVISVQDDDLIWGLSPATVEDAGVEVGDWKEVSTAMLWCVQDLAHWLFDNPSAALIIDYGYTAIDRPAGPTLQAVRDHTKVDPLDRPGRTDLTWLIDFDAAAKEFTAENCPSAIATQAQFLTNLGIGHRAQSLARLRPDRADDIANALERLTRHDQMGTLFKVLGAVSPGISLPPGFERRL